MSNSPLVNYTKISPYKNSPRNRKISGIAIHCMAGNLSVQTCGNVFQNSVASSNYGIDENGNIGMYVEEKDRAWCTASSYVDNRSVSIEVANYNTPDCKVSDTALKTLINLCVDICKRNGIKKCIGLAIEQIVRITIVRKAKAYSLCIDGIHQKRVLVTIL